MRYDHAEDTLPVGDLDRLMNEDHDPQTCKRCGEGMGTHPSRICESCIDLDGHDPCPTCGGELEELGALAFVAHYRCRHCGLDHTEGTP